MKKKSWRDQGGKLMLEFSERRGGGKQREKGTGQKSSPGFKTTSKSGKALEKGFGGKFCGQMGIK